MNAAAAKTAPPDVPVPGKPAGRALAVLVFTLCLVPLFSWLEWLLRDPLSVPFLRSYLIEVLTLLFLVVPLLALFASATVLVALALIALRVLLKKGDWRAKIRALLRAAGRLLAAVFLCGLLAFWWFLAGWQPAAGAGLAALFLTAFLLRFRRTRARCLALLLAMGLTALVWIYASHALEGRRAAGVEKQRLYPGPAYDAALTPQGDLLVLDARQGKAFRGRDDQWQRIENTYYPQRLAVQADGRRLFIANYNGRWRESVTRLEDREARLVALPGCYKTIDVALAPENKLLVACEFSGTLHLYDILRDRVDKVADVPMVPYALAVDDQTARAYVTSEHFLGNLTQVDLAAGAVVGRRWIGQVNWGAAFDPRRRLVWVARPISGELLALDENLTIRHRVRCGGAPRDLALDPERDVLLVGQYFSGVLTVLDLATLEPRALRAAPLGLWHQLRGVAVGPHGEWLVSDNTGLWKINRNK